MKEEKDNYGLAVGDGGGQVEPMALCDEVDFDVCVVHELLLDEVAAGVQVQQIRKGNKDGMQRQCDGYPSEVEDDLLLEVTVHSVCKLTGSAAAPMLPDGRPTQLCAGSSPWIVQQDHDVRNDDENDDEDGSEGKMPPLRYFKPQFQKPSLRLFPWENCGKILISCTERCFRTKTIVKDW